jgi:preprotein translocase subunit SecF
MNILEKQIFPQTVVVQERFESIGPIIGKELTEKALWQIALVAIGILSYIAWAFRRISKLKEQGSLSWKLGVVAIIAVIHDCLITVGVFAMLGKYLNVQIDSTFIAAILLVFGYSVNDTIVIFDRIRENLLKRKLSINLEDVINKSVAETAVRSFNTSSTTLLVLFTILLFGGGTIFYFILALIVGIGIGTYSSIFLAAPLLYEWQKRA